MNIAITNNPMVKDKLEKTSGDGAFRLKIEFYETDFLGVLIAVRDRIHLGHSLLTHPLSGSIKPWETPYKTIIISGGKNSIDEKSLSIIEESIQTCVKLKSSVKKDAWSEKILADFQLIDYNLIFS